VSEKRYRPFSNGSQWYDWQDSNCFRCKRVDVSDPDRPVSTCPILEALNRACVDDGTVSEEIARRMGYLDARKDGGIPYGWPCGDVEWTEEWKAEWRQRQEAQQPLPLFPEGPGHGQ
jgi:hypothetical protein